MAHATAAEGTYGLIADLPLQIEGYSLEPLSQPMSEERVRRTTIIRLWGGGEEGAGEDATPVEDQQLAFQTGGAPRTSRPSTWSWPPQTRTWSLG